MRLNDASKTIAKNARHNAISATLRLDQSESTTTTFSDLPITSTLETLTYKIDGRNNSARVPWAAISPAAEMRRIEEALKKQPGRGPKDPVA